MKPALGLRVIWFTLNLAVIPFYSSIILFQKETSRSDCGRGDSSVVIFTALQYIYIQ